MKRFNRMDRVSELVKRELSTIIDAEFNESIGMISVTGAEVSRDLRNARVFISKLGTVEEAADAVSQLNEKAPFIRKLLGQRIVLKYTPELRFIHDTSLEYGMHMEKLFHEMHEHGE